MSTIRIGGVPEHYNAPFQKALESGCSDFTWTSFPGGTGAMLEALEKDEIDMAVLLTEGVVKQAVTNPGTAQIIGTFVDNPLPWGVHVRPGSFPNGMSDLNGRLGELKVGISRFGSGSHLMAIVHASRIGVNCPEFVVINNMAGAADAMKNGTIDVFLWDITTADIHTRSGIWEVIGTVCGNWPAFVMAIRPPSDKIDQLTSLISLIRGFAESIESGGQGSIDFLVSTYHISQKQAIEFLDTISWNCECQVRRESLLEVLKSLHASEIIRTNNLGEVEDTIVCRNVCIVSE
jgi:hypothetical protein